MDKAFRLTMQGSTPKKKKKKKKKKKFKKKTQRNVGHLPGFYAPPRKASCWG